MKKEERRGKMREGRRKMKKKKGTNTGSLPVPFLSPPPAMSPPTLNKADRKQLLFSNIKYIFSA